MEGTDDDAYEEEELGGEPPKHAYMEHISSWRSQLSRFPSTLAVKTPSRMSSPPRELSDEAEESVVSRVGTGVEEIERMGEKSDQAEEEEEEEKSQRSEEEGNQRAEDEEEEKEKEKEEEEGERSEKGEKKEDEESERTRESSLSSEQAESPKSAKREGVTAGLKDVETRARGSSEVNLNLHVVSALRVRTSGHPLGREHHLPQGMKQGAVDVPAAYGVPGSFTVAAVAWLPDEDPLEIFSLYQGLFWLPGWGSRVTTAVTSHPCTEKGAIGEDDIDFFQEFNVSVSAWERWPGSLISERYVSPSRPRPPPPRLLPRRRQQQQQQQQVITPHHIEDAGGARPTNAAAAAAHEDTQEVFRFSSISSVSRTSTNSTSSRSSSSSVISSSSRRRMSTSSSRGPVSMGRGAISTTLTHAEEDEEEKGKEKEKDKVERRIQRRRRQRRRGEGEEEEGEGEGERGGKFALKTSLKKKKEEKKKGEEEEEKTKKRIYDSDAVAVVEEDGSCPMVLVSLVQLHASLAHESTTSTASSSCCSNRNPYQEIDGKCDPLNMIGPPQIVCYDETPPLRILGTAILPLRELLRRREHHITREDLLRIPAGGGHIPVELLLDGSIALLEPCRLFAHHVVRDIVSEYRLKLQQQRPVPLWQVVQLHASRLRCIGTLLVRLDKIYYASSLRFPLSLKTSPSQWHLYPQSPLHGARAFKSAATTRTTTSTGTTARSIFAPAAAAGAATSSSRENDEPPAAARGVWVEVDKMVNVILPEELLHETAVEAAVVEVVILWTAEEGCSSLFKRSTRRAVAEGRCMRQCITLSPSSSPPRPSSSFAAASDTFSCDVHRQLFLPFYPGVDPVAQVYILLNGHPYACLAHAVDVSSFSQAHAAAKKATTFSPEAKSWWSSPTLRTTTTISAATTPLKPKTTTTSPTLRKHWRTAAYKSAAPLTPPSPSPSPPSLSPQQQQPEEERETKEEEEEDEEKEKEEEKEIIVYPLQTLFEDIGRGRVICGWVGVRWRVTPPDGVFVLANEWQRLRRHFPRIQRSRPLVVAGQKSRALINKSPCPYGGPLVGACGRWTAFADDIVPHFKTSFSGNSSFYVQMQRQEKGEREEPKDEKEEDIMVLHHHPPPPQPPPPSQRYLVADYGWTDKHKTFPTAVASSSSSSSSSSSFFSSFSSSNAAGSGNGSGGGGGDKRECSSPSFFFSSSSSSSSSLSSSSDSNFFSPAPLILSEKPSAVSAPRATTNTFFFSGVCTPGRACASFNASSTETKGCGHGHIAEEEEGCSECMTTITKTTTTMTTTTTTSTSDIIIDASGGGSAVEYNSSSPEKSMRACGQRFSNSSFFSCANDTGTHHSHRHHHRRHRGGGEGPVCAHQCAAVGEALHVGRVGQWEEFLLTLKNARGETITRRRRKRRRRRAGYSTTFTTTPTTATMPPPNTSCIHSRATAGVGGDGRGIRGNSSNGGGKTSGALISRHTPKRQHKGGWYKREEEEEMEEEEEEMEEEDDGDADADVHLINLKIEPLGTPEYLYVAEGGSTAPFPCIEAYRHDGRLRGGACTAGILMGHSDMWEKPLLQWHVEKENPIHTERRHTETREERERGGRGERGEEEERGELSYRIKYKHDRPGYWKLHITYGGLPIAGSPFELQIFTGRAIAGACKVVGHVLKMCYASPSPSEYRSLVSASDTQGSEEPLFLDTKKKKKKKKSPHCWRDTITVMATTQQPVDGIPRTYEQALKTCEIYLENQKKNNTTQRQQQNQEQQQQEQQQGEEEEEKEGTEEKNRCDEEVKTKTRGGSLGFDNHPNKKQEGRKANTDRATQKGASRTLNKNETQKYVKVTHYINRFRVAVCDEAGNRVGTGGHCLSVKGENGAQILRVLDEGDGVFCVEFVVYVPKTLLQKIDVTLLEKSDQRSAIAATSTSTTSDFLSLQTRDGRISNTMDEGEEAKGCGLHTQVKIHVKLSGKHIFGSPYTPLICNLVQLRGQYDALDGLSLLNQRVERFEELLRGGDYVAAAAELREADEELQQPQLKQQLLHALERLYRQRVEAEAAAELHALHQQNPQQQLPVETMADIEIRKERDIRNIQNQWQDLQILRDILVKLSRTHAARESIIKQFAATLLQQLQKCQTASVLLLAEQRYRDRLLHENILPLALLLRNQYAEMLNTATNEILRLVRGLDGKTFADVEDLLQLYKKIGEELRRLHRYRLADIFDEINDCLIEELELQRLAHQTKAKEERCAKIEKMLQEKEKQLKDEQQRYAETSKQIKPLDLEEAGELAVTRRQIGVQTEDALSLREGIFGPLIVARATGRNVLPLSAVVSAVKKSWRSCNVYDIHTTIKRLLKSCPRLKHCLSEVFLHYGKVPATAVKDLECERLPVGLPQGSFMRFCCDAGLEKELLSDPLELQSLFEKFSVEPSSGRVREEGFLRVLPLFLWLPCLRELAYLDLLHATDITLPCNFRESFVERLCRVTCGEENIVSRVQAAGDFSRVWLCVRMQICRESLARGENPVESLQRRHPSRLCAFYYFCDRHFLPLYEQLYGSIDFHLSYSEILPPPSGSGILVEANKERERLSADAVKEHGGQTCALLYYSREYLPYDIFTLLRLEPMQHLFAFYSELSMEPSLSRYRRLPLFPTSLAATAATAARGGGGGRRGGVGAAGAVSLRSQQPRSSVVKHVVDSTSDEEGAVLLPLCISPSVRVRLAVRGKTRRRRGRGTGASADDDDDEGEEITTTAPAGAAAARGGGRGNGGGEEKEESDRKKQGLLPPKTSINKAAAATKTTIAAKAGGAAAALSGIKSSPAFPGGQKKNAGGSGSVIQGEEEEEGEEEVVEEEYIMENAWMSLGIFVQMLLEFGVIPGFIEAAAAMRIGRAACERARAVHRATADLSRTKKRQQQQQQQKQQEEQEDREEKKKKEDEEEEKSSETEASQDTTPKNRLVFETFIEALVNVTCECTVRTLVSELDPAAEHKEDICAHPLDIKRKAASLLELFGLNSVPRILLLTKRPLQIIS